jgi:hypothetical protein
MKNVHGIGLAWAQGLGLLAQPSGQGGLGSPWRPAR